MTVLEIARVYTDLVKAEREISEAEHQAKEKINALRTKYHEILMAKMREERIDFSDGIGQERQVPAEAVLNRWDSVPFRRCSKGFRSCP